MAIETVVLTEAPRPGTLPAPALDEPIADSMISSIEDDIASILATLERQDLEAAAAAGDDDWAAGDYEEEPGPLSDEPVSTLWSELNRLWVSDPEVVAHRLF